MITHTPPAPTLDTCDREPIHIPGSIQPHGALLAFDRLGRLSHASANAAELLGLALPFGQVLRPEHIGGDAALYAQLRALIADCGSDEPGSRSAEAVLNGRNCDVVMHTHDGLALVEFEPRDVADAEVARFAHLAYQSMDALKRQKTIDKLLASAVQAVRTLTGFDRVMAYRFRHDDSGEVVAESCDDALEPYLGRRYPASDIPAQARRLYVLNTLRLIVDARYQPVPLLADAAHAEPLDLSHSVLRSVSPIHLEYLGNMGVAASMSVSIVIGGRLWGMLACHHRAPLRVPYPIRMAVDVMAQVIASAVQSLEAQAREAAVARAAWLRTEIVRLVSQGTEVAEAIQGEAAALADSLRCDSLFVAIDGAPRLPSSADGSAPAVDPAWARALTDWLSTQTASLVHVHERAHLPPPPPGLPELPCCGLLALRFDAPRQGWIVAQRREQVQTIRWGGKPEKVMAHGPLGPRLTPRGSFQEWRETVRDTAEPWNEVELEIASQLRDSVARAHADRVLELDQLRSQFWAVLGHDLRNPLQSLSMATSAIARGHGSDRLHAVVRSSTDRMRQLVSNLLDVSRLQHGFDLTMQFEPIDLVALVEQLLGESRTAHPATRFDAELPAVLVADIDQVRFAQVVANLLSNARVHGQGAVRLRLLAEGHEAVLAIENDAPPIPDDIAANLFDPFKRMSTQNLRNRSGLGLGLYIAAQVVHGHGGTLSYRPHDGRVVFEVRVPMQRAPADKSGA